MGHVLEDRIGEQEHGGHRKPPPSPRLGEQNEEVRFFLLLEAQGGPRSKN